MSEQLIYSVYDSKAEAFLPPFFTQTRAVALRSFSAAAQTAGHDFQKWAGDYALYELGTFEQTTGVIKVHDTHINLGLASQYTFKE